MQILFKTSSIAVSKSASDASKNERVFMHNISHCCPILTRKWNDELTSTYCSPSYTLSVNQLSIEAITDGRTDRQTDRRGEGNLRFAISNYQQK